MTDKAVKALGYLGFDVTDVAGWRDFMTTVFGLEPAESAPELLVYRIDANGRRLCLHKGDVDRIRYVGWELAPSIDLSTVQARLAAQGVAAHAVDAEDRKSRRVRDMIAFDGPDGTRTEIFHGAMLQSDALAVNRQLSGFKTGPFGLGHIVFATADEERTADWYQAMLGFQVSDRCHWDGDTRAIFLRCNPRHHSIAFHNEVYGMQAGDVNHLMLEANDLDDVGRAYDAVKANGYEIGLSLGKHSNDQMLSFYVATPSGWWIEYGWGGLSIDDAQWETKFYDSPKIWGHIPAAIG